MTKTIWQAVRSAGPEMGKELPQVQEVEGGYWNISDQLGVQNQLQNDHFPDGIPPFGKFKLHKRAKATDIVSTVMMTIRSKLVSTWCKTILETLDLRQHWFFPVGLITHSGEVLQYYVFHFNNDCSDLIDFSKSIFALSEYSWETYEMKEIAEVTFENKDEYDAFLNDRKARKGKTFSPKKVFLNGPHASTVDIFYFDRLDASIHVSSRLRKALEEARITGWEYQDSWVSLG